MTKKELRLQMKRRNLALTAERRAEAAERIFARVEACGAFAAAGCVAVYCALPDEPPTREVLARWAAAGKRLVVPRVEGDTMRFFDYDPATLVCGAFGIAEPGPDARLCEPSEIDFVLVPGTAFTAEGGRMGRGRGYYDKYLAQPGMHAVKAGMCYRHQLVCALPAEPHDIFMDQIITD